MTLNEETKDKAERCAENDFEGGKGCDSGKYGARKGSAWDKWYTDRYLFIEAQDFGHISAR